MTTTNNFERVSAHICMQKDVGINGNLFGGVILAWTDECCAIFARERTQSPFVVTMRFGEMVFHKPIREGDVVSFYCGNETRSKHSISFSVEARINSLVVLSTTCTFVAVDAEGKKTAIDWVKADEISRTL